MFDWDDLKRSLAPCFYGAYRFKKTPGAFFNRVMLFITLARRVKHRDVFHKSIEQYDLKLMIHLFDSYEWGFYILCRWPFFMFDWDDLKRSLAPCFLWRVSVQKNARSVF